MLRWGAGIILAGFLAGGGIALALSGGSAPAAAGSTSTADSTQAATLNSVLDTASSTTPAVTPRIRWALGRLRALGGVDGQFTIRNASGYHTLAFERGTIQSVNSADLMVKAADGTTWTWDIVSDTVVRHNGAKVASSTLATGQAVFVGGPVTSGNKGARLIVIKPDTGSSGTSSSSAGISGSSSVSGPAGTTVS
jgi:hypothetical protein